MNLRGQRWLLIIVLAHWNSSKSNNECFACPLLLAKWWRLPLVVGLSRVSRQSGRERERESKATRETGNWPGGRVCLSLSDLSSGRVMIILRFRALTRSSPQTVALE